MLEDKAPMRVIARAQFLSVGFGIDERGSAPEKSRLMSCRVLFRGDPTERFPPQIGVDVPTLS